MNNEEPNPADYHHCENDVQYHEDYGKWRVEQNKKKAMSNKTLSEFNKSYQDRVNDWMLVCFGPEISADIIERNHRFFEESAELVQSTGMTKSECLQLVDYVFNRGKGETIQEIGGVMVTLAALCNAVKLSMVEGGEKELARIWTKVEKIREKQANKPKHSPLPQYTPDQSLQKGYEFAVRRVRLQLETAEVDYKHQWGEDDINYKTFKNINDKYLKILESHIVPAAALASTHQLEVKDQDTMWHEVKEVFLRNYEAHNYPSQAVKELTNSYTIIPKH
jgi:hypothetical protein